MSSVRKRWKIVFTVLTLAALVVFTYALRRQIFDTIENLKHVNSLALILMVPLEALNYYAQANLYRDLFGILGKKFRFGFMYRMALELNFVNNVFPSAGVSGFSYIGLRLKSRGITATQSSMAHLIKSVTLFISYQILIFIGLLMLAIGGHANNVMILVAGSLATLVFILTFSIVYVIGSKERINGFFTVISRALNKVIHIFRPNHPETINIFQVREIFTELHEDFQLIRKDWQRTLRAPLLWGLMANLTEVLTIYIVYVAFGRLVNPGAVIIAYAVANFAGFFSVLPGGVGMYEALMTGILVAAGVPAGLSLSVTVMYRVLNMLIQMPPGYILYQRALRGERTLPENGQ